MSSKVEKQAPGSIREPWRDPLPQAARKRGHPQQKDTLNSSSSSESGSCFSDCLAGLWRFLAWLFSCCGCCSSKDEETERPLARPAAAPSRQPHPPVPARGESKRPAAVHAAQPPPSRPVTMLVWIKDNKKWLSSDVPVPAFTELPSISDVQKRWRKLALTTDDFVLLVLQADVGREPVRWMMHTGVYQTQTEHFANALAVFYEYVSKQIPPSQLATTKFQYSLGLFYRHLRSADGACDCYLDSNTVEKEEEIRRHETIPNMMTLDRCFPDAFKKGTLFKNLMLRNLNRDVVVPLTVGTLVFENAWRLQITAGKHSPLIYLRKYNKKEIKK